jgi:dTDP-4-dehydrorhamnose reductase
MLGSYLPTVFGSDEILITDIEELDVRDRYAIEAAILKHKPGRVFHLAAATDVDRCEKEPDWAYQENVIGTLNVALICQKYDVELTYISTVAVCGGTNQAEPYTEFDTPNPPNMYAKTKLEGEVIVRDLLKRYYIVRAGWMMGGGPEKDHKFVGKMTKLIQTCPEVTAVADKFGSPTYAKEFAANLRLIVESGYYGIFHLVNGGGRCSRWDMAVESARCLERDQVTIRPVNSATFPLPAPRPRSEVSRNYKLELLGLNHMSDWRNALRDYLGSWPGRA